MTKRLFVSSLPYSIDEMGLKAMFEPLGKIVYARIIRDDRTKFSKGYGFVEMATEAEAEHAIKTLDKVYDGKPIKVSKAYNTWQGEAKS